MKIKTEVIERAYAELSGRKLWRRPLAVYLTRSGRIIVGTGGAPIPAAASLVCNYRPPLVSLAEFTGDIEHEAQLMQAVEVALPERILAVLSRARKGWLTTNLAREVGARTPETGDACEALWREGKIGRKREKPIRGPWRELWVKQTDKPTLRPVHLPTGPDAPARCAGRYTTPGAKVCQRREDCARYRALIDTWNQLPDAERMATPVHSQMCTGSGTPHFMEIRDDE